MAGCPNSLHRTLSELFYLQRGLAQLENKIQYPDYPVVNLDGVDSFCYIPKPKALMSPSSEFNASKFQLAYSIFVNDYNDP